MRVENSYSNKTHSQGFGNAIFVDISKVPNKKLPALLKEFESKLGRGPAVMSYSHNGNKINQDVFIGYNQDIEYITDAGCSYVLPAGKIKNLLIATGNDLKFGEELPSKLEQVNNAIVTKVQKILEQGNFLKTKKAAILVSGNGDDSGGIFHLVVGKNGSYDPKLPQSSLREIYKILPQGDHVNSNFSISREFLNKINNYTLKTQKKPFSIYNQNPTNIAFHYDPKENYRLWEAAYTIDWKLVGKALRTKGLISRANLN